MSHSQFVYVTYIRVPREKVWDALTNGEFMKQYWFGMTQESDWKAGSSWTMKFSDGRVADMGEVVESNPPQRLVLKWRNEFRPELKAEGFSRCVYELEQDGETTKLVVTHAIERENAKLIEAVSGGWPKVLSSLKSFLETGTALPEIHKAPQT
jgi:uncharacterized protein YndB with AHSA1/START domain